MDLVETSCEGQLYSESKCFTRFIALSRGLRPLTTLARIKCFLTITHERIDGSYWKFLWGSVLLRVKALYQIYCVVPRPSAAYNACTHQVLFAYKSWMDGWILMILTYIIDIDETLKLTQGQGHKVKGQGHIGIYVKIIWALTHEHRDGSW